jgi:3-deoxy-D-manno-octulosonic-acid transferase
MFRLVYNLLFPVVLVVLLPGFVLRMVRRGNYRHKFGQRFGIYSRRVLEKFRTRRWTWIHAVSVGEVRIALRLVERLREREPGVPIALSTTTSTGYRLAHRHRSATFEPFYHPLDFPPFVARTMHALRPQRLLLVEAEVWPNVMAAARKAGIPRVLVNARLSPRSERRYRALRIFAGGLFNQLDAICLQEPGDIDRWRSIGVHPEKLHVTGSIKFDEPTRSAPARDLRPALAELGWREGDPVMVAGSTFAGEEIMLARVAKRLREAFPGLFLVIVPRHAERGTGIATSLKREGFPVTLRIGGNTEPGSRILVANTTGELRDWFACATLAYIGKSLSHAARGGQNPAEPIAASKPVIFGPNMQNFASLARQLVSSQAALEIHSEDELADAIALLLNDPGRCHRMAVAAAACLDVHRGATSRTVDLIHSLES